MIKAIRRSFGTLTAIAGVLLILAALWLTLSNIRTDNEAGKRNTELLARIEAALPEKPEVPEGQGWSVPTEFFYTNTGTGTAEEPEMPAVDVDGRRYIGILTVPRLGLKLSVMESCDDASVDVAPGRFAGTAYENGFVIGGHNYVTHLGKIDRLREGDTVTFTDLDGNEFDYTVIGTELLEADEADKLKSEEWGLSLFTCTLRGNRRITVRCLKED